MVGFKFISLLYMIGAAAAMGVGDMKFDWTQINPLRPQVNLATHHTPALAEANAQLSCMLMAVHWATTPSDPQDKGQVMHKKFLKMIHDVFGLQAKVDIIKTWTEELARTTLVIGQDNAPNGAGFAGTFAITDPTDHQVFLFSLYHAATHSGIPVTKVVRARILLHEGSHAFRYTTWDWWSIKDGHVFPVNAAMLNLHEDAKAKQDAHQTMTDEEKSHILHPLVNGYWHAGYSILRGAASHIMHENADSWAVFGYHCLYNKFPFERDLAAAQADPRSIVWSV